MNRSSRAWLNYRKAFKARAEHLYGQTYVDACLKYAGRLDQQGLPIIYEQEHLAQLVGHKIKYLRAASNAPKHFYRTFYIAKANGNRRRIDEPLPSLKKVQRWIVDEILNVVPVHSHAKGFVRSRSIKDNARFHRCQQVVLKLDIRNFFGSVRSYRVHRVFKNLGYAESVAALLANLCCLHKRLPQGAPTSPALSNLVFHVADCRIAGFAAKLGIRYTRYADDLSFSGDFEPGRVVKFVRRVLKDQGLMLNEAKTKVMKPHQRQAVTGIVVNADMQAPRSARSELRQTIYYIEKYGLESHLERIQSNRLNYVDHLRGMAHFIRFVNPDDEAAAHALQVLSAY